MHLLVGLGNPGQAYAGTRHNVGFAVVERVAAKLGASVFRAQKKNSIARARLKTGDDCLLALPQTFMNLSGESIGPLVRFYKLLPQQVLVVHDELDFPLGRLRFKPSGGHGGHNGLRSLLQHLPGDFSRLRLGIGVLGARTSQLDFVLGRFAPDELDAVERMVEEASAACIDALEAGLATATLRLHGAPR